jgi:hypothetical protein
MSVLIGLREAGDEPHSNVRKLLRDAVYSHMRDKGSWGSYVDHTGDGDSGDCIYEADGSTYSCPYEVANVNGKSAATIDHANATKVTPMVEYRQMADDDDHYTSMQEAMTKTAKLYAEKLPLYERYIGKAERDKAPNESFAGKSRSFPILKPSDVSAAVHAMGRAGSDNHGPAKLKANIIAIAKAKGWEDELPKSWRGEKTSEARRPGVARETVALIESSACQFLQDISLTESARANYPVMLISPGTGATAHYPADVLERDGPKVFKKGTLMFWNHQTSRESTERPEGDLNNLAAILTEDARYNPSGPKGPGLYSQAKVMADYAQRVEERAPHIGLSIRAGGTADGTKVDGKPVLKSIDYAESVDYVTKAGRGGLALAEAARDAGILPEEGTEEMTLKEAQDMVAKEVSKATAPLLMIELRRNAREEGLRILEGVNLHEAAKAKIVDAAVRTLDQEGTPVLKEGVLQLDKWREVVVTEAKSMAKFLRQITGAGNVVGMGSAPVFDQPQTPEQIAAQEALEKRQRKQAKRLQESSADAFTLLAGGNRDVGTAAANHTRRNVA